MKKRVMAWINGGDYVTIFTARAHNPDTREAVVKKIHDWLEENGMPRLPVTHEKHPKFCEIWDDRAHAVEMNTGRSLHD
jgi:hypothetical protein